MKEVKILGIKITPAQPHELHAEITRLIETGKPSFVLSGNVHSINLARKRKWLSYFINSADIVRVDGGGVVLAAKLLGYTIPKRLTWADWGWLLSEYLAEKKHSLFLLGGPKGIAKKAGITLTKHAPGLIVVGAEDGYFNKNGKENDEIIKKINSVEPDILVVGMGMPLQEMWLLKNHLRINAKVFITAGAAFEFLSGSIKRCPKWMGENNLEWLFRLFMEPKRMLKRYLWGNTVFIINILRQKFINLV